MMRATVCQETRIFIDQLFSSEGVSKENDEKLARAMNHMKSGKNKEDVACLDCWHYYTRKKKELHSKLA